MRAVAPATSARAGKIGCIARARLVYAVELATDIVARQGKRCSQLIGATPELRRDETQIADQNTAGQARRLVLCCSADRPRQAGDPREQEVNLL